MLITESAVERIKDGVVGDAVEPDRIFTWEWNTRIRPLHHPSPRIRAGIVAIDRKPMQVNRTIVVLVSPQFEIPLARIPH